MNLVRKNWNFAGGLRLLWGYQGVALAALLLVAGMCIWLLIHLWDQPRLSVYLIAYEVAQPAAGAGCVTTKLKQVQAFQAQAKVWFLATAASDKLIRNFLQPCVSDKDILMVSEMKKGAWATVNMQPAAEWLSGRGF